MSKTMTWNEFKKHVDLLLEEKGCSRDEEIEYIDVSIPDCEKIGVEGSGMDAVQVNCGKNGRGISINN